MFDFDASKLLIIGVVALIVIGPKDLPRVLRQVGQMVTKLRRMAGEFQGQFMEAMKEADLADLKNEVTKLKDTASLDVVFNPVADVKDSITKAVDGSSVALESPLPRAVNPYGQNPIEAVPPPPAAALPIGPVPASGAVTLTLAEPAHHTPAVSSGGVHAVEAETGETGRRRRIVVAKRRPPGDRVGVTSPAVAGRGRSLLPPRRDPRP